jgi:hypothetical protein
MTDDPTKQQQVATQMRPKRFVLSGTSARAMPAQAWLAIQNG